MADGVERHRAIITGWYNITAGSRMDAGEKAVTRFKDELLPDGVAKYNLDIPRIRPIEGVGPPEPRFRVSVEANIETLKGDRGEE